VNKAQGLGRRAQGQKEKKLCASESSVRDNKVIFTAEGAEKKTKRESTSWARINKKS